MKHYILLSVLLSLLSQNNLFAQTKVPNKEETIAWIVKKFQNNLKGGRTARYVKAENMIEIYYQGTRIIYFYLDKINKAERLDDELYIYGGDCCRYAGSKDMAIITCIDYDSEENLASRMEKAFQNLVRLNKKSKDPDEAF